MFINLTLWGYGLQSPLNRHSINKASAIGQRLWHLKCMVLFHHINNSNAANQGGSENERTENDRY